jgi:hypothetical protein
VALRLRPTRIAREAWGGGGAALAAPKPSLLFKIPNQKKEKKTKDLSENPRAERGVGIARENKILTSNRLNGQCNDLTEQSTAWVIKAETQLSILNLISWANNISRCKNKYTVRHQWQA